MRLLLTFLMTLSFSAFADVTGTWAYSGSGCRDSSLDPDSHRSKIPSSGETMVSEAIFTFNRDGTAEMKATFEDGGKSHEKGTYTLRGDRLTIHEWDVSIKVVENRIVIQDEEEDEVCDRGEVFVYILGPVD